MRPYAVPLLAMALAGLGACGSPNQPVSNANPAAVTSNPNLQVPTSDAEAGLYIAVADRSNAAFTGDADRVEEYTAYRCLSEVGDSALRAQVADIAQHYGGTALPIQSYGDMFLAAGAAKVSYTFSDSSLNRSDELWLLNDGQWQWEGC